MTEIHFRAIHVTDIVVLLVRPVEMVLSNVENNVTMETIVMGTDVVTSVNPTHHQQGLLISSLLYSSSRHLSAGLSPTDVRNDSYSSKINPPELGDLFCLIFGADL